MIPLPPVTATRQLTTYDRDRGLKVVFVPPGERRTLGVAEGPGYLARLWLTFPGWFWPSWEADRPYDQRMLKTLIVSIYVDDAAEPQVSAPAADLFGLGLTAVASWAGLWAGASSGGFYLALPMPFTRSLRIEVENRDPELTTDVFLNALYQRVDALPEGTPYLHGLFSTGRHEGPEPLLLADVAGRGRYAGCTVSCQGERPNYLSFLEAPEHVRLNGATEPQIVGTGMEDYFLGGWYFREGPFAGPEHGVPVKDALRSSVSMYRFHDRDAIHFAERLAFSFEPPKAEFRWQPYAHSAVAYVYLDRPVPAPPVPPVDELLCWYRTIDTDHQAWP